MEIKDGTPKSGFVTERTNHPPRECGNCRWFKNGNSCTHPEVANDEEVPNNFDGTKQVDSDDCCDFFQNVKLEDTYATCLNRLLASSIVLRDLYRKSHWQVTGQDFSQFHILFDNHYDQQDKLVDMIAERIQSLDIICVASATDVIKYSTVEQPPTKPEVLEDMLCRLYRSHQVIADQCKLLAEKADSYEDKGTNDLIVTDVLRTNEKQKWFIRQHLDYDPIEQGKRPILLILRHGETTLNANNSFRSWIDVPLDENGIEQGQRAARFLSQFKIGKIYTSPLGRAVASSLLINEKHEVEVVKDSELLPWNLGELSGKPRSENMSTLDYYIDHPDETVPGGESLNDFQSRMFDFFGKAVNESDADTPILLVGHTSTITALNKWANNDFDGRAEEDESVGPGGVCALYADDAKQSFEIDVLWGKPRPADYGS